MHSTSHVTRSSSTSLAPLLLAVLLASGASAQVTVVKVQEAASNAEDFFGVEIAVADSTLAAAEFGADFAGAVHIFDRLPGTPLATGWVPTALIVPPDSALEQRFGEALALDGDTLLVGAPHDDEYGLDAGAAFVWLRDRKGTPADPLDDAWVLAGKLFPQDALPPAPRFGHSVALAGDTAVIGSFQEGGNPATAFAYVFVRDDQGTPGDPLDDSFVELFRLAADGPTQSRFGEAVALSADAHTLIVGDSLDNTTATTGAVTVFVRDDGPTPSVFDEQWLPAAKLEAPAHIFALGSSLALAEDGAMLLATGFGADFPNPGIVLVFDREDGLDPHSPLDDTWRPSGELAEPDGGFYLTCFGRDIALEGQRAFISAPCLAFGPPFKGGVAFLSERQGETWSTPAPLRAPDEGVFDGFGGSLALRGAAAFSGSAGAPYVDDEPAVEGAVYVFDLALPDPWTASSPFPSVPRLGGWGALQELQPVTVRLYNTFYPGSPAMLVIGTQSLGARFKGSILEPLPQILLPLVLGPNGDVQLSSPWLRASDVPTGTTLWMQGWLPPSPQTGGVWLASNGLSVTQP